MVDWEPISEAALGDRIRQGYADMPREHQHLWDAISIVPAKWEQHPYGDAGGGFWAVAVIGRTVIWFNDVEDGFNRSVYTAHGVIEDYWCNDDELNLTILYLANALRDGRDLALMGSQLKKRA